jgi:hypothetical protein
MNLALLSDERDQPITVIGGSITIHPSLGQSFKQLPSSAQKALYTHSDPGALGTGPGGKTKYVSVTVAGEDPVTITDSAGFIITLEAVPDQEPKPELTFSKDSNTGALILETRINFNAYVKLPLGVLQHPSVARKIAIISVRKNSDLSAAPTQFFPQLGIFTLVIGSET